MMNLKEERETNELDNKMRKFKETRKAQIKTILNQIQIL